MFVRFGLLVSWLLQALSTVQWHQHTKGNTQSLQTVYIYQIINTALLCRQNQRHSRSSEAIIDFRIVEPYPSFVRPENFII